MRCPGLASLLLVFGLAACCRADETLVLELPSSQPPPSARTSPGRAPHRSPGDAAFARYNQSRMRRAPSSNLSSRHKGYQASSSQKVVGRLGVAASVVTIRSGPGSHRRALARVQPGTYLALTGDGGSYYGVLMADSSTGWVAKSAVQVLNYEVVGPNTPRMPSFSGGQPPDGSQLPGGGAGAILQEAYRFLGVPYRWGGTKPTGMDCSAFVQRCFASVGISLPRTAHEQYECGLPVTTDQLRAADRLYFASRNGKITHTGIYIGNDYFIHSSSSRGGVAISRLSEPMYTRMYAGARRS